MRSERIGERRSRSSALHNLYISAEKIRVSLFSRPSRLGYNVVQCILCPKQTERYGHGLVVSSLMGELENQPV